MITDTQNAQLANWIHYITRPDIHPVILAKELLAHKQRLGKSEREFAKIIGMKRGKLYDTLCLAKYTVEEYDQKIRQGVSKTELYNLARRGKNTPKYFLETIGVFHKKLRDAKEGLRPLELAALEKLEDLITNIIEEHHRGEKTGDTKMLEV